VKPVQSKITVYQRFSEDRVYEAVTDDSGFSGVAAVQKTGPKLDIIVTEHQHVVERPLREEHQRHTVRLPTPGPFKKIELIEGPMQLDEFLRNGPTDELRYRIDRIELLQPHGSPKGGRQGG
jgi:hypothetical protein